jgi:hypothetical protein
VALAIDKAAVRRGAIGGVVLFTPIVVVLRALAGGDKDSGVWVLVLFAFPFAFMFAGWLAAYERPASPLVHGTVAGGLGFAAVLVAFLAVRSIFGGLTAAAVIVGVVLIEVAAGFGCLGALVSTRGIRATGGRISR